MSLTEEEINKLLQAMIQGEEEPHIEKAKFAALRPVDVPDKRVGFERLNNVSLRLVDELGRTKLKVKEVLDLKEGSLITLDKLVGELVELQVNGIPIAYGEVVVINDAFGIKISSIARPVKEGQD